MFGSLINFVLDLLQQLPILVYYYCELQLRDGFEGKVKSWEWRFGVEGVGWV